MKLYEKNESLDIINCDYIILNVFKAKWRTKFRISVKTESISNHAEIVRFRNIRCEMLMRC